MMRSDIRMVYRAKESVGLQQKSGIYGRTNLSGTHL